MSGLEAAAADLAARCGIGAVRSLARITTGYEDTNLDVQTDTGRYVVKLFDPLRPAHIPGRTVDLIALARRQGVRLPRLLPDRAGRVLHTTAAGVALVMPRLPAVDYYVLGRPPSRTELTDVVEQSARIHLIEAHPTPVHDEWAIGNLPALATQLRPVLDAEQQHLIATAEGAFGKIDQAALPRTLIHGDLTKGNVLAAPDGAITLIDFSCCDRHPRIQELAVIAANLTHDPDAIPILDRARLIAELYPRQPPFRPLSPTEHVALPAYTFAAAAMEFLGAVREDRFYGNRTSENLMVMELGLLGLRQAAQKPFHRNLS